MYLILSAFIFCYLLWIFAQVSHHFAVGGSRLKAGMTEVELGCEGGVGMRRWSWDAKVELGCEGEAWMTEAELK
ncbi:hypothetical protein [Pseudoalteromonas rubra]|uniref:hypothetical protein n=1 Tax=Pseudoalteromonas rubra TaxID=43658 RepID=UPI000F7954A5|nr:hypothetical protein [Pseudoalteromonas rubra]